jgi:hypothetical protein
MLALYVIFYFAFNPSAVRNPASLVTSTFESIRTWIASMVEGAKGLM